ncbi:hypothetical protein CEXT_672731 [Caerostris extrusa]|uniref:Uncharacterized protein n=1 Tax=Caerostris extrusa TaxID=172846 RepID=A0AAV4QQT8_CAEEX|nr:hypothetical protein CEXT_672731 [Caerostris extrusa]
MMDISDRNQNGALTGFNRNFQLGLVLRCDDKVSFRLHSRVCKPTLPRASLLHGLEFFITFSKRVGGRTRIVGRD